MKAWADSVAMLLSTDWFQPYWPLIGLQVPTDAQDGLKKALRDVVMDFVPKDGVYWNASFTDQRINATKDALLNLFDKYRAEGGLQARIEASVHAPTSDADEAWLLLSINELIFSGELSSGLPSDLVQRLHDLWLIEEDVDFEALCLSSDSKWDVFVRSLTGQPSSMSDFVVHDFVQNDRFSSFWARVCGHMSHQERAQLVKCYEAVARDLTGQELTLSIR